jgi:hypothetical protein
LLSEEAGKGARATRFLREAAAEQGGLGDEEVAPLLAHGGATEESDHVLDTWEDLEDHQVVGERHRRHLPLLDRSTGATCARAVGFLAEDRGLDIYINLTGD